MLLTILHKYIGVANIEKILKMSFFGVEGLGLVVEGLFCRGGFFMYLPTHYYIYWGGDS